MFDTFFLKPIYNAVIFLLDFIPTHDVGIAIILITILIKLILLKPNLASQKSSYLMREAQVEIEKIKTKYKDNKAKIAEETMRFYKEKNIKPFASILVLIIQIPIFFALYYVFRDGFTLRPELLYTFNKFPETIKQFAFGFLDLSQKNVWVGVLTGLAMFILSKRQANAFKQINKNLEDKKNNSFQSIFAKSLQTQTTYFLPILIGATAAFLPSALGVYWTTNNILSIFQDIYIKKKLNIGKNIKNIF